jgi:leader peptidase (prepilin peptidase)/N-methyltransferase
VFYFLIFIFGLFVGSFLNVLVDRLPRNENVIKGRSYCESCKKELKWYDLVPVLSFVILNGKCRFCKAELSLYYPIIELTTGVMFALTYAFSISNFQFLISNEIQNPNSLIINPLSLITMIYYLLIVSSFIVIFFSDLKYGIIPDKILWSSIVVPFLYLFIVNPPSLIVNLLCGIGAFLFFIIISVVFSILTKKESMGGGDIKLTFLLGLFLGFPNIIVGLYLAFLTGALAGIILIIWKKKSFRGATLPFGPFLILGAVVSLFWGNFIFQKIIVFLGL